MTIASLDTRPSLFPHRRPHQRNDPNGFPSKPRDLMAIGGEGDRLTALILNGCAVIVPLYPQQKPQRR